MPVLPVIRGKGLYASGNFASAPAGSYARADNVHLPFADVLEPMRGHRNGVSTFGSSSSRADAGSYWESGNIVVHYDATKLTSFDGNGFDDHTGSFTAADDDMLRMKFVRMAQSLFFNTSAGIYAVENPDADPSLAGVPKAYHATITYASVTGNPDSGWMPEDTQVAYRAVWGIKDGYGRIKLGAPSPRIVITNPADFNVAIGNMARATNVVTVTATTHGIPPFPGSGIVLAMSPGEANFAAGNKTLATTPSATSFTFSEAGANATNTAQQSFSSGSKDTYNVWQIPPGITTSHFLRIYRSLVSEGADLEPDDEMYLAHEARPSSSDISNGTIAITDRTPEAFLGVELYTNANSGEGPEQANERPVIGKDIFEFDGRLWMANTTDKHRFHLQLLGVGSPDGLQNNDTITIGGATYTAKTTPGAATDFKLYTVGTPAQNIYWTAWALANCVIANSSSLSAYYESADSDPPGKILIEEDAFGGNSFSVYASRVTAWNPILTTSSSGAQSSSADRRKNGLSFTKQSEPDHLPVANFLEVGSQSYELLRAVPLRDKIYCFPEVGGIYTVSGSYPYRVDKFDNTATLIAPDTVVEHGGALYALTTQGFVAITEAGVRLLSKDTVEGDIQRLIIDAAEAIRRQPFAVSDEAARQVEFWMPTDSDSLNCTQAWVYNSVGDSWTKRTGDRSWGFNNPVTLVSSQTASNMPGINYYGDPDGNRPLAEAKTYAAEDFYDRIWSMAVTSSSGLEVVLDFSSSAITIADVSVGDMLFQSDSAKSIIESIDTGTSTVTVVSTEDWQSGGVNVLQSIPVEVAYLHATPEGPAIGKQFRAVHLHFREFAANTLEVTVTSDNGETETIGVLSRPGFGLAAWGSASFGDSSGVINRRIEIGREHARCTQLQVGFRIREAMATWKLHGISFEYEPTSERSAR